MRAALTALLLWLPGSCWAQVTISAEVDKTDVALNDQIVLAVTVTGPQTSLPEPEIPSLPNFSIYSSGRNQNITFVNGSVSSSIIFTYVLEPRFVGKGVIPPIAVVYQGHRAQTSPIEIQVGRPGASAPTPTQQAPGPARANPIPAAPPQRAPAAAAPQPPPRERKAVVAGAPVFVQAVADKKTAFVNEQVTLTVRFYTSVNLLGNPQYIAPKTDGFLAEDLPPERHGNTVISNRTYYFSEIKTALFPAQAGRLGVGPATVRVQIQQNVNVDPFATDFFEKFFSQGLVSAVTRDLVSEPLSIAAQALPEADKPKDFSGAVGRFSIAAAVDRSSVKVGDAVGLTVTVGGVGNLKAIGDPRMPELPSWRVYDTVTSLNLEKKDDKVQGSKVFKTVLVPRVSGDLQVPAIGFSYFDPEKRAYVRAESLPLAVKVAPSPGAPAVPAGAPPAGAAPQGVTAVSQDIRYLKGAVSRPFSQLLEAVAGAGPVNAAPIFAFAFCLGLAQYRKAGSSDPAGARLRGAAKAAMGRIEESLKSGKPGKAAALMSDALTGYLADKLGQSASGLTLRRALELLGARRPPVDAALLEGVRELWSELDMRRFAPGAAGAGAKVAQALRGLIAQLEEELER
ncbi:MAG: protein BatD [Elusimicrobia bacterium]|nr:protein BatD [Elusimicrobiota bacterium]